MGWAVWAACTTGPGSELRDRLAGPLLVVFAGFSVWIAAAEIEPTWATVVVFGVMLAGLLPALARALEHRGEIATWSTLGRGQPWVCSGPTPIGAASGSGQPHHRVRRLRGPISGPVGVAAQLAVLAGAGATAVALIHRTHSLLPYVAAVAWAFLGATIGAAHAGAPVLATAATVGLIVVLAATVLSRQSAT